jgi:osmotically inducible protein OsmC
MPTRTAEAVWNGSLMEGKGQLTLGSKAFSGAYDWKSRAGDGGNTNPEELIAAAHAGCFSMALSAAHGKAGFQPQRIATDASVKLEKVGEGFGITQINLTTVASVPGIDDARFREIAEGAKENCPVSKALKAVDITLDARLE